MQTTFFNTIGAQGNELKAATQQACKLADLILKVFKEYPRMKFTPFDVQHNIKRIYGKVYPITSVRARMTELSRGVDPELIKSEKAEGKGIYLVANHKWQLNCKTE